VGTLAVQLAKLQDVEITGVDSAVKLDMMRSLGFDHVIDYAREDFTRNGRRYDLILDVKTNRWPFEYPRALNPGGTYVTVGGVTLRLLLGTLVYGWSIRLITDKTIRLIGLRQNQDLPYLNERFEAGQLMPVIDGAYTLSEAREAFRHYGAGHHKGKVVITIG
jgi:NADPH:quinone reductase-like Zn-dependent oxidoreductase